MISVSPSADRRVALFLLYLSLSFLIMADSTANALSPTSDVPTTNTSMRTSTRAHRHHQAFKGQNFDIWKVAITSKRLKPAIYNKVRKRTSAVVSRLCTGNVTHILTALLTGSDYQFAKHALTSTEKTAKITFRVKYDAYSKHQSAWPYSHLLYSTSAMIPSSNSWPK